MKCLNLHCHPIEIFVMRKKKYTKELTLQKNSYSEDIFKWTKNQLALKCKDCQEFNNEYQPNYSVNEKNNFYPSVNEASSSLFCFKDSYEFFSSKEIKIHKLFEFNDIILIGTKEEIISYISQEYYLIKSKIKKLDTENEINDLNLKLNSEKDKNIELNNKLSNISSENDENIKKVLEQNKKCEELEENMKQKENAIKEINDSLIKEKNINQNISENLNMEKEKNKILNDKLENIASENNENMKKILQQLQDEKNANENLKSKFSELEKQEKLKNIEKEKLETELKVKNEELQNVIKNYVPENFGLKFESDSKTGEYDIILDITSFRDLIKEGWLVKYNKEEGKQKYLKKKDEPTIVAGVIGNGNKGKSFILEKLSGYEIPKGFNVKTVGLSIRYGTSKEHNVAILDSAGQETPLLKMKNDNIIKEEESNESKNEISNANSKNEEIKETNDGKNDTKQSISNTNTNINNKQKSGKLTEDEENIEFEQYSRDKLITEFFLQKFIIWKSDVLILVVGNISLTEQKLLLRIKKEVKTLDKNKQIFVIHNLKDYSTEEQINDYIENTLKKLYKIEIEETNQQNIIKDSNYESSNYFDKYFMEKGENVSHFIFINDFSEKAKYYNTPTIRHIQKEIEVIKTREKFSIIEDCKEFLVKIAEEIMEENPKIENLITIENEKCDKIVLKNLKEITLKNFVVDEVGYTFNNDINEPKYSHYINPEDKTFYINIELPGGGEIEPNVTVQGNSYYFIFEGIKKGDEVLEADKKNEVSKLISKKNIRKNNRFKLIITIPCSVMQLKLDEGEELSDLGECTNDGKGVYTFKYKVIIVNQKNDKKKKKKLEL